MGCEMGVLLLTSTVPLDIPILPIMAMYYVVTHPTPGHHTALPILHGTTTPYHDKL